MDTPNTESKKMYCKYLKSFILSNKSIINTLYQKDLKTCLKEFSSMVTSVANYVSLQQTVKKSTILTIQMIKQQVKKIIFILAPYLE